MTPMSENTDSEELAAVRALYRSHGVGSRVGFGRKAAVIVVDFQYSYTRTWRAASLAPVEATARLLEVARRSRAPVVYSYMGYDPQRPDAGVWGLKAATLVSNVRGSQACEIDALIPPAPQDWVIEKRVPSVFFGSGLAEHLRERGVDTIIVVGTSTSGCVRATAVDGLSHDFRVLVPRECVADPSEPSARVALSDLDTKYGDVMDLDEVLDGLRQLACAP
jgi:maleamate amidohydrolase